MNRPQFILFSSVLVLSLIAAPLSQSAPVSPATSTATAPQDAEAIFQLARAHLSGKGAAKDPKKALELMQIAAEKGHAEALGGVGYFYANGIEVAQDEEKAVEWFRKGAEKGGPRAMFNLARMLVNGKGVTKDEEQGRDWLKKSAEKEVPEAVLAAASMYLLGENGEPINAERAYPYALKAAEQGQLDGQNMVGIMLCEGQGVPRNRAEGLRWYRKAAEAGHLKAQYGLGMALGPFDGGANKDHAEWIEGIAWLMVAADNKSVEARKLLDSGANLVSASELAAARNRAAELRAVTKPSISSSALRKSAK